MFSIPVEILRMILEHLGPADLTKMCLVNKICCSCSQDVLYRDVDGGIELYRTLAESTDLARRVRSFTSGRDCSHTADALRNMSSLRRLCVGGKSSHILEGCTFKLVSLECDFRDDERFRKFLNNQPGLTDIEIHSIFDRSCPFDKSSLPNLTRITAFPSWLRHLIPGRPVRKVTLRNDWSAFDLSVFTHSTTPIQKLTINYICLYPTTRGPVLAQIFPSLTHLSIDTDLNIVCDLFIYLNDALNTYYVIGSTELS
jgi:F-box domain